MNRFPVVMMTLWVLGGCDGAADEEMLMGCSGECPAEPCLDGEECLITCEAGPLRSLCEGGSWVTPYVHCPAQVPGEGGSCAAFLGEECEYPRYCPSPGAVTVSCRGGVWRQTPQACEPCGAAICGEGELCLTPLYSEGESFCTAECGGDVEAAGDCLEEVCLAIDCVYQVGANDRILCSCL